MLKSLYQLVKGPSSSISEKHCSRVLHCLRENAEAMKSFLTLSNTPWVVRGVFHAFQNDHVINSRFTKLEGACTNELLLTMYSRDSRQILMEQMATAMSEDVVMEHRDAIRISHLLNAEIDLAAWMAGEREEKLSLLE